METKRIFYLIISIVIPAIWFYVLNNGEVFLESFVIFIMTIFFAQAIPSFFYPGTINFAFIRLILPFLGIFTLFFKKTKYSGLGYFYLFKYGDKIVVYEQKLFYMNNIFTIDFDQDITKLRKDIQDELEDRYKEKLKKKKKIDSFNNWDGSIDKATERESILNDLKN